MSDLKQRIGTLAGWIAKANHPVFFTGAGISTESGLPDFRGPDGVWTRQAKGEGPIRFDWADVKPNPSHFSLVDLQEMGKLSFLISQNVDNLHLQSGIGLELLAELHGNVTKLQCRKCGFKCDNFPDLITCPICEGRLASSVVDFGQSLPEKDLNEAEQHSRQSDLFVVVGSSLVVHPAAGMPGIALRSGARLVIINQGETPLDRDCHLRFDEAIDEVLPVAVREVKDLILQAGG